MKNSLLATGALLLAASSPAVRASAQVDQALTLIRATCSLPNTSLDIKPTPEGRLELRIVLGNGQRRTIALANRDLDTFQETAVSTMVRLPMDLTACMDPYVSDVVTSLATLPERPGPAPVAAAEPYMPPTYVAPAAPPQAAAPPQPALPPAGELPVAVVNNAGTAVAVAAPAPPAAASGEMGMRVTGCHAAVRNVVCDVRVNNDSGKDLKLVVQGGFSKLYGEDGTQLQAAWVTLGNQQGDLRWGRQAELNLIAGTSPVVNLTFHDVPGGLTAIKRLEISMGPHTANGVEMQKITLADVPIQGR